MTSKHQVMQFYLSTEEKRCALQTVKELAPSSFPMFLKHDLKKQPFTIVCLLFNKQQHYTILKWVGGVGDYPGSNLYTVTMAGDRKGKNNDTDATP